MSPADWRVDVKFARIVATNVSHFLKRFICVAIEKITFAQQVLLQPATTQSLVILMNKNAIAS